MKVVEGLVSSFGCATIVSSIWYTDDDLCDSVLCDCVDDDDLNLIFKLG